MAALDKLPYETLVQILSSLSSADLASTSRLSRHLCDVSEPLLYQSPCLAALRSSVHRPSLERFVETVIHSPRETLVTHVRSLSLRWDHTCRLDAVTYAGTEWFIGFQRPVGFHGTKCVLLLHLLPSVCALRISPPRDLPSLSRSYLTYCIEKLDHVPRASPDRPTLRLQSLREFSCPYQAKGGGVSVRAVLALMKLPCINSIDTHIVDQPMLYSNLRISDAARFSPVRKLRLSANNVSISWLSFLVNAPTALTHFSFSATEYDHFQLADFMDTLTPLRPSLQYLHLDFTLAFVSFNGGKEDRIRSSVRGWPVLHTLSCSAVQLFGNRFNTALVCLGDMLPLSLRGLQILQDWDWHYAIAADRVVELLGQKGEAVPALERVAMGGPYDSDPEAHAKLSLACRDAGVRLVGDDSFRW